MIKTKKGTIKIKSKNKTIKNKANLKQSFKKISPQTVLNLFGKPGVAIVNTLDDDLVISTHTNNTLLLWQIIY